MSLVLAIRAGSVRERSSRIGAPQLGLWLSAIEKHVLSGPARITALGVDGDQQADRKHHGGLDKAVLAYCAAHYKLWQEELDRPDFMPGTLGENLEMQSQSEADVCIGDIYSFGSALLQVSQPRQPCWKPAMLHGLPELTTQMAETSRTGWYLRVLEEGVAETPCEITLIERPHPDWTVERANRLIYHASEPGSARRALAGLPELSAAWKSMLIK